jgi:hypothetical protein
MPFGRCCTGNADYPWVSAKIILTGVALASLHQDDFVFV